MLKYFIPGLSCIVIMTSCSSLKSLTPSSKKETVVPVSAAAAYQAVPKAEKAAEVKFLEDISVDPQSTMLKHEAVTANKATTPAKNISDIDAYLNRSSAENASPLLVKYASLLNTETDQIQNMELLESVDEWYGTPYLYGGATKNGIDCSAFVQAVYTAAYAISVPRTAREQYRASRIISAIDLKEGDLLFFNTTGGISHVGIYLCNNKFVHASSSQGVVISDIFDNYYLKRYIGAGRIEKSSAKN